MSRKGYLYILASSRNGTLYIGVTGDLARRIAQHKAGTVKGFTSTYKVYQLVYYEVFDNIKEAIAREKALKKWNRAWKIELIEASNPEWEELPVDNII